MDSAFSELLFRAGLEISTNTPGKHTFTLPRLRRLSGFEKSDEYATITDSSPEDLKLRRDLIDQTGNRSEEPKLTWIVVDRGFSLATTGVRVGFWIFLVYQARLAIEALAGKATAAEFMLSFLSDTPCGITISISFAGTLGASLLAYRERKLRQNTIARLTARIHQFENQIDPDRTTSGLMPDGRTNPRDL